MLRLCTPQQVYILWYGADGGCWRMNKVDLSEDTIGEERSEQYKDGEEYSC